MKEKTSSMAPQSFAKPEENHTISPQASESKKTHQPKQSNKAGQEQKDIDDRDKEEEEKITEEISGRERLKKHRIEVAGRVWIPEKWGQEELLKDWIDCSAFEANLVQSRIFNAKSALVQQDSTRRATTGVEFSFL